MKNLRELDKHRVDMRESAWAGGWSGDETCGAFVFPSPVDGQSLRCIASNADGWDHVSVSRQTRCPNWTEMDFIKRKFFLDNETAMQLHVPPSDHINNHPYVLHMWRPHNDSIPMPPKDFV